MDLREGDRDICRQLQAIQAFVPVNDVSIGGEATCLFESKRWLMSKTDAFDFRFVDEGSKLSCTFDDVARSTQTNSPISKLDSLLSDALMMALKERRSKFDTI